MKNFLKAIIVSCFIITPLFSCNGNDGHVKGKYLDYMDHRIYYELRGNAPKTLVFIHGWTGSTGAWKYQVDSFPGYRVVAIDLPGNGKSSKNENAEYSVELFADSVYRVLKKEKIENAFFIGHSMGLAVCDIIAQKYPGICAGICSMDGAHFDIPEDAKEKEKWIEFNRNFANTMTTESGRENFINMLFQPDTPQMLKEEVLKTSKLVPLKIGKSMIDGVEKDRKFWGKRTIRVPFLAIYSPAYQLPPDYEKELKKTYPQVEYHYIPGVSHFLMMEVPYRVNQLILDFVKKYY